MGMLGVEQRVGRVLARVAGRHLCRPGRALTGQRPVVERQRLVAAVAPGSPRPAERVSHPRLADLAAGVGLEPVDAVVRRDRDRRGGAVVGQLHRGSLTPECRDRDATHEHDADDAERDRTTTAAPVRSIEIARTLGRREGQWSPTHAASFYWTGL
ncbi:MAG: hypothetical protein M3O86_00825 [Actinomycetota bacterium]|nr:hypothetical protein [Actinomycetota bacterium]